MCVCVTACGDGGRVDEMKNKFFAKKVIEVSTKTRQVKIILQALTDCGKQRHVKEFSSMAVTSLSQDFIDKNSLLFRLS